MGRSSEKESSIQTVAPFLKKCYDMVDDSSTDSVISWTQSDSSFVIWDLTDFSVRLLPKYFKHSNFSSFIRQLNIYGFRKIDSDRWEFANDGFIRGQKDLLKTIARRKNSQGTDNRKSSEQQENSVEPGEKVEKEELWKEVENLKTGKNALMQELKKLRQHQEIAENNLLIVRKRMQGMEKNQQQMLSFLVMVMQNPGFLVQLLHPKEHNWRMAEPGSIIEQPVDDAERLASGGVVVKYQPLVEELTRPVHIPTTDAEKPPEPNGSSAEMKDVFIAPDFMKVLMDENFPSLESHAPFILPELSDDVAWEQLLSHSPFVEDIEDTRQDSKEPDDTENDLGSTVSGSHMDGFQNFDFLTKELENPQNLENSVDPQGWLEKSQGMEMITKQLGRLVSETNHEDGLQ